MSDDALLLANPAAQSLIDAGVPRSEVLAGLRGRRTSAADSDADADVPMITRTASIQGTLPSDWEERFDPASGRKFYVNHETRSTTWTRPRPAAGARSMYPSFAPRVAEPARAAWDLAELSHSHSSASNGSVPIGMPLSPVGDAISVPIAVPITVQPAAAEQAAPPAQQAAANPARIGVFSRMFNRSKSKPTAGGSGAGSSASMPASIAETAPTAAPEEPTPTPEPLDLLRSADFSLPARLEALQSLTTGEADAPTLAMRLVDVLGSTDEPTLQAALCRAVWSLAESADVRTAIIEGGGILYIGALLGATPNAEVEQETALLLVALSTTAAACAQIVAADGIAAVLALISRDGPVHASAMQLIVAICTHRQAAAVASAGGAPPLTAELMRAAAVAKGWGGTPADGCRDAKLALVCLGALAASGPPQLEAVRHAVRDAGALPSLVALLGTDVDGVDAAAMSILAHLELSGQAADELANTGGIALLCESLAGATDSRLQAVQTLATLSASAVSAVAIAEATDALPNLFALVGERDEAAQTAALTTLANLCAVGALPGDALRSQTALATLATAATPDDPRDTAAAAMLIAQAAQDVSARAQLADLGVPHFLASALSAPTSGGAHGASNAAPWAAPGAVSRHATMALAHFAADDALRTELASWGALAPLVRQLTPLTQPDARTRAMALSALANFSFIDPNALVEAGLPSRLGSLLFEADNSTLAMALTALTNVTKADTPAAAAAVEPLLNAGTPLGVHTLLSHTDAAVKAQALAVVVQMCHLPRLASAFAESGAVATVVAHIADIEPLAAGGLATALRAMTAGSDAARREALTVRGVPILCKALLGCPDLGGRYGLAHALSTLLKGEWAVAFEAAGWPALLAVLSLATPPVLEGQQAVDPTAHTAMHAEAARGAAALLVTNKASREALGEDANALRFLTHCLTSLTLQPDMEADEMLALGASHALVATLESAQIELVDDGARALIQLANQPRLVAPLAEANAAPAIVRVLGSVEPAIAAPLGHALGTMVATSEEVRRAALAAGGAAAVSIALLKMQTQGAALHAEGRTILALTLAALVRDDWSAVHEAGGWQALVAALAAAAANASPAMRQLADAATPPLLDSLSRTPASAATGAAASAPLVGGDPGSAPANYSFDDDEATATATSSAQSALAGGNWELD